MACSLSLKAVTIVASFPPVSAAKNRFGLVWSILCAVSSPPVKITKSTSLFATKYSPAKLPGHGTNCRVFLLTPASQKHLHSSYTVTAAELAGFIMAVFPEAKMAANPPRGIATGKFQGGVTTPTPLALILRFVNASKYLLAYP